jgi:hypothetical protein
MSLQTLVFFSKKLLNKMVIMNMFCDEIFVSKD